MKIIFTILVIFFSSSLNCSAQELDKILATKKILGSGNMTYLFMKPYFARLYVEDDFSFDKEFALELKYNMHFAGIDIAKRSIDEIKIVASPNIAEQEDWLNQMIQIFPNVKKNDRIVGVYKPSGKALFFYNDKFIGEVEDKKFAIAFFSIWLNEKTSEPKLRKKLLALK